MPRYFTWIPHVIGEGPQVIPPPPPPTPPPVQLTSLETQLLVHVGNDAGQQRKQILTHATLCSVARERARDMATRGYFSHTDPDGNGPNFKVTAAGYALPSHYKTERDGNNVESIGAGYPSAAEVWAGWLKSEFHRIHVLGEWDFYREQVYVGVGHWHDPNSKIVHYWCFLSAP